MEPQPYFRPLPASAQVDSLRSVLLDSGWTRLEINGGSELKAIFLWFDPSRFNVKMFTNHHIDYPSSIQRSIVKRKAEFFFGRLAARLAISDLVGAEVSRRPIGVGDERQPVWPEGILGSISHTDSIAAAAVTLCGRHRGIGIDIEKIVDKTGELSLQSVAINDRELGYLHNSPSPWPLPILLTIIFSAKESLYKAAFNEVGHYFDFNDVELHSISPLQRRLHLCINKNLSSNLQAGTILETRFSLIDAHNVLTYCAL